VTVRFDVPDVRLRRRLARSSGNQKDKGAQDGHPSGRAVGWPDHTIIGTVPADVPTGEHEAIITVLPEPAAKPFGLTCRPKTSGGMVCLQSR
jgi:hypothetical protein